ncbi:MAG: hypothetical protein H7196_02390 [candidate division SR1 bacterium]|nr:hypothetical protein [candidate division SR1 bacterium]
MNSYIEELQGKVNTLIKEYNEIKNKITEEEFAFELKRKNSFEIINEDIEKNSLKESTIKSVQNRKIEINKSVISDIIRNILKI